MKHGPHPEQDHRSDPAEEPSEECESWDADYEDQEQGAGATAGGEAK